MEVFFYRVIGAITDAYAGALESTQREVLLAFCGFWQPILAAAVIPRDGEGADGGEPVAELAEAHLDALQLAT